VCKVCDLCIQCFNPESMCVKLVCCVETSEGNRTIVLGVSVMVTFVIIYVTRRFICADRFGGEGQHYYE
jgi:hypothetical protein